MRAHRQTASARLTYHSLPNSRLSYGPNPDRDGRVAPASQWCRSHAGHHLEQTPRTRPHRRGDRTEPICGDARSRSIPRFKSASRGPAASMIVFAGSSRITSTSPPKGRSGCWSVGIAGCSGWRFSTSYHTRFPEYLKRSGPRARTVGVPVLEVVPRALVVHDGGDAEPGEGTERTRVSRRRFAAGRAASISRYFTRARSRRRRSPPVMLYVGRVSHEKNIEDFLRVEGTRHEADRRRRPRPRGTGTQIPGRSLPRLPQGAGTRRGVRRRRSVRVSRAGRTRSASS